MEIEPKDMERLRKIWEDIQGKIEYMTFEEFESKYGSDLLELITLPNPYFSIKGDLVRINDIPRRYKNFESGKRDPEMVEWLTDYLRKGEKSHYIDIIRQIKTALDVPDERFYVLLGKKGFWNPEELPFFYQEGEIEGEYALDEDPYEAERVDLTKYYTFAVDDDDTIEVDDAISIADNKLMIHVADVASVVHKGSALDESVRRLATSIYVPEGKYYMFPKDIIGKLSLSENRQRALTLVIEFDEDLNVKSYKFVRSWVKLSDRFNYQKFERILNIDPFKKLLKIARRLQVKRMENGGVHYVLPAKKIEIKDGEISYKLVHMTTKAYTVITELMILYNYLAAKTLANARFPAIYRTQVQDEPVELDEADPLYRYRIMTSFKPTFLSPDPYPHNILGLEVYGQFTSPLRRYVDLVNQRQLHSLLDGREPEYSREELEELIQEIIQNERRRRALQKDRLDFWTYEYIRRKLLGRVVRGVVAQTGEKYSVIFFPDFLISEKVYYKGLPVGTPVNVQIKSVDPYNKRMEIFVIRKKFNANSHLL